MIDNILNSFNSGALAGAMRLPEDKVRFMLIVGLRLTDDWQEVRILGRRVGDMDVEERAAALAWILSNPETLFPNRFTP